MEKNYDPEYTSLLKKTVSGAKFRVLIMGYSSYSLKRYLNQQHQRLFDLECEAREKNSEIKTTREHLKLEHRLFEISTKMIYS